MIIGHQEDLTSSLDPNLSIQLSRALIDRDQTVARKIADSFFSRYLETANTQEARKAYNDPPVRGLCGAA